MGIDSKAAILPTVITPTPVGMAYNRPRNRPSRVEAFEGHTMVMVTSATSGATTPAIGWLAGMNKSAIQNRQLSGWFKPLKITEVLAYFQGSARVSRIATAWSVAARWMMRGRVGRGPHRGSRFGGIVRNSGFRPR